MSRIIVVKKQMNLSFLTRTCKHYLESEQENAKKFYEDVKENIGNEEDKRFVDECLEKIKANEMFCMSKEGSKFNDIITKAFDNYLEKHVKIVQIGKLS